MHTSNSSKTRFRPLGLLSVLAALLALAGCGAEQSAQDSGGGAEAKQVLRVVRNVGGRESFQAHWDAWKAAFERDNPGWEMELVNVGDTQGSQYYMSRIATNDLPEVIQTWDLTRFLADNGHLIPLPDSYYTKFGMALPAAYKGKRYATMGGTQLLGIAVNTKMWAEVGVTEPPATWEAFIAALKRIQAAGHKPMTYGAKDWSAAMPLSCALHTNLYDHRADDPLPDTPSWSRRRDAGEVRFSTDPVAAAIVQNMIELLSVFTDDGALSAGYNESKRDFYSGESACWIMGCWIGGDIEPQKVEFEVDYWPLPSMTGRTPVFFTGSYLQTGWSVTTSAQEGPMREKAMAVLDALYDPKTYQTWLNAESMVMTARQVPGVTGAKSDWAPTQHFYDSVEANYERYGVTRGASITLDDMLPVGFEAALNLVMQQIVTGSRDVAHMLKELDDEWDSARQAEKKPE